MGTRVITNQQSGTSYEQATLPFGTALNAESTVSTNKKRFTSYDRSERTGLDYAVNRNYDSKQGRFTSVDPIGMSASSLGSPQTLNLYSYCGNDPINYTDPSGLFFGKLFKAIGNFFKKAWKWIAIAVAVAVIVFVTVASHGATSGFLFKLAGWIGKLGIAHLVEGGGWVLGTTGKLLVGLSGVGAIANHFTQSDSEKKYKSGKVYGITSFIFRTFEEFGELIKNNNKSGVDDNLIKCQVYAESHPAGVQGVVDADITSPGGSHRGLLMLDPAAAQRGGLGNGKGGISRGAALEKVNPDYIKGIYDPATNIQTGTSYLKKMIGNGSVRDGLAKFRIGPNANLNKDKRGYNYADAIQKCANGTKSGVPDYGAIDRARGGM